MAKKRKRVPPGRRWWYGGIDLGLSNDLAAYCLAFPPIPGDNHDFVSVFHRYYLPEENIQELEREAKVPYRTWAEQGWLTLTDGNVIDFDTIRRDVLDDAERWPCKEICLDPSNANQLTNDLMEEGLECYWHPQGAAGLGPATKDFERRVLQGLIRHDRNPITAWMMSNVRIAYNRDGVPYPVKADGGKGWLPKKRYKVDGVIAMLMSVHRAATDPEKPRQRKRRTITVMK